MLKKYKPICPAVSSKDFNIIQDFSIVDKQDSEQNAETPSNRKKRKKKRRRQRKVSKVSQQSNKSENEDKEESELEEEEEEEIQSKKPKAAWVDEDDNLTLEDAMNSRNEKNRTVKTISKSESYGDYLKKKFTSRFPRPTWADYKPDENESKDGEDLTKQAGGFIQKSKNTSLAANYLSYNRVTDVNKETRGEEGRVVTALEFHPSIQVALVGGKAGVLSLFQITGGADNPKLAQVKAESFPIRVAHFCGDSEILAGSNKSPDIFVYQMERGESSKVRIRYQDNVKNFRMSPDSQSFAICGENGSIRLYSSRTKEFRQELKMNCYVNDVVYAPNGSTLYSTGGTGHIYEWDLRSSPVPVRTFVDDGCIQGTRLAINPAGNLLAAGSSSGVVNLYTLPDTSARPAPAKTLLHLMTAVTELKFNHSGEILAFASLDKNGAVKMYNVRSQSVFGNFPDARMAEKLCRPNVVDFSPGGGFFAFSNNDKSAFLLRLNHYANY